MSKKLEAVKHYLGMLPDGYRERALTQIDEEYVENNMVVRDMFGALGRFARWHITKEGDEFWEGVYHYYSLNDCSLPTLPEESTNRMSDSEAWVRFASAIISEARIGIGIEEAADAADDMLKQYQNRFPK